MEIVTLTAVPAREGMVVGQTYKVSLAHQDWYISSLGGGVYLDSTMYRREATYEIIASNIERVEAHHANRKYRLVYPCYRNGEGMPEIIYLP